MLLSLAHDPGFCLSLDLWHMTASPMLHRQIIHHHMFIWAFDVGCGLDFDMPLRLQQNSSTPRGQAWPMSINGPGTVSI
jgi:hypothetical protein